MAKTKIYFWLKVDKKFLIIFLLNDLKICLAATL